MALMRYRHLISGSTAHQRLARCVLTSCNASVRSAHSTHLMLLTSQFVECFHTKKLSNNNDDSQKVTSLGVPSLRAIERPRLLTLGRTDRRAIGRRRPS